MLLSSGQIKCDGCGKFIGLDDLIAGIATRFYALPDSEFSRDTFESECMDCKASANRTDVKP